MCGRIAQYKTRQRYADEMGWAEYSSKISGNLPPRYNVPPGTSIHAMHCLDGGRFIDAMPWGHHTAWAKEKKFPPTPNASIEKAHGAYWRALWKSGRVVVPADGWYEWTGPKGNKQPWYIRRRDDHPLFIAAVSSFNSALEQQPYGAGIAMVTADTLGGMVDVADRRPVVLSAEDAQVWLDLNFSAEQAEQIARESALPPDAFEWYQVSRDVNKSGNESPQFIIPITLD